LPCGSQQFHGRTVIYLTAIAGSGAIRLCVVHMENEVHRESPVVLLVDDHEDSAAMYAIGLLAMGFEPVTAETAEDGFERACHLHPDVVVADVSLGGTSGLELTRRLRSDPRTRDAGIIVLTGHAYDAMKDQARAAGCDRFLIKPCLPDVLALEIRDVLQQRQVA
jgi:CheY-like chemotaxis protein